MTPPRVAFFSMPDPSHFRSLVPVIARVVGAGMLAQVHTHGMFRSTVETMGAEFVDLFTPHPLDDADPGSFPRSCRYISYAAHFAERVAADLLVRPPDLIVYGTFAVIGFLVAKELGVPFVNVATGHNVNAREFRRSLPGRMKVELHPNCEKAIDRLRNDYGMRDADPFSFIDTVSPFLNIYGEPEEFLTAAERAAFEPVAFFGPPLPEDELVGPSEARSSRRAGVGPPPDRFRADLEGSPDDPGADRDRPMRVLACFGTIIWRHHAELAHEVLRSISVAISEMGRASALISLGGHELAPDEVAALRSPRVRVESYVDQWPALRETDIFITHNGVNSTHESIARQVPMISYPFFWDQPALARRCEEFGVAIPLVPEVRGRVQPADVVAALDGVASRRHSMEQHLETAREWERRAIRGRDAAFARIADLIDA